MKDCIALGYTSSKTGTGSDYEPEGGPGDKGEGGDSLGLGGDGGDNSGVTSSQVALHSAFNAQHGRPAVSADPDNAEGSPMPGNPTAAEGAKDPYAL